MITKYGTDSERQDSCFYANGSSSSVVWSSGNCFYYVVACGEMRIYYTEPDGTEHTICTTTELDLLGFDTDEKVRAMGEEGEEVWSWVNNNWFEVYSDSDLDFYSEPIDEIDTAIAYALELHNKEVGIQEPDIIY